MLRKPRVIVSGLDKTGKSTICKALAKAYDVPLIKTPTPEAFLGMGWATTPNEDEKWDIWKVHCFSGLMHFETMFRNSNYGVILDRSFPDEYAYSKVLHKRTFDPANIMIFDEQFAKAGFIWVYMGRDYPGYEDVVASEEKSVPNDTKIYDALEEAFNEFSYKTKMPVVMGNMMTKPNVMVERINAHLNNAKTGKES